MLAAQAATSRAEALKSELPELRIALLHGKIAPAEKDKIMAAFRSGEDGPAPTPWGPALLAQIAAPLEVLATSKKRKGPAAGNGPAKKAKV